MIGAIACLKYRRYFTYNLLRRKVASRQGLVKGSKQYATRGSDSPFDYLRGDVIWIWCTEILRLLNSLAIPSPEIIIGITWVNSGMERLGSYYWGS